MRKYIILIICLLLIMGAVFTGVFLKNRMKPDSPSPQHGDITKSPNDRAGISPSVTPGGYAEVVYEADREKQSIDRIMVAVLSGDGERLTLIGIDTDISYTMTKELYNELTPEKVTLPQTVLLKGLYGYYGDERAFEAGIKIIGEMLGIKLERCAVFDSGGFDPGIYKSARECGNALVEEYELPVVRHNETTLPDTEGAAQILYDALY